MRGERCSSIYPDVLGAQMLLRYDVISANCCSILSHPRYGTKVPNVVCTGAIDFTLFFSYSFPLPQVYPATMFTTAPLEAAVVAWQKVFPDLPSVQH